MARGRGNLFLVAAAALPLVVVAFFVVATAVPRWTVSPPAHDLVLAVDVPARAPGTPGVAYTFAVRDGRIVAAAHEVAPDAYVPETKLFLFDHASSAVREVPVLAADATAAGAASGAELFVVAELAARRATSGAAAPDGYRFELHDGRGAGLIGEVFGMGRSRRSYRLIKDGRVVPLDLPIPYPQDARAVAWLMPEPGR